MRNVVQVILTVLMTAVLALACDKPCEVIIPDKPEVPGQEVVDTLDTPQNPDDPENPQNPETPDNPDEPVNPGEPDAPQNPENPGNDSPVGGSCSRIRIFLRNSRCNCRTII